MTFLNDWRGRRRRRIACRRKYGNACPHVERHSRAWTRPNLSGSSR